MPVHTAPEAANFPVGLRRLLWAPAKSDGEPRKICQRSVCGGTPQSSVCRCPVAAAALEIGVLDLFTCLMWLAVVVVWCCGCGGWRLEDELEDVDEDELEDEELVRGAEAWSQTAAQAYRCQAVEVS